MENMEKQPKKFHSDNMEAVRKFFYGINWTTFYQEKMALQETRELILNAEDTPKNINAVKWIDGVLNMMDAMGDVAEQIGLFVYPSKVGLPEHRFDTVYEGDPDWYELCVEDDLTLTDEMPTVGLTVDQLVENFEAAKSIC